MKKSSIVLIVLFFSLNNYAQGSEGTGKVKVRKVTCECCMLTTYLRSPVQGDTISYSTIREVVVPYTVAKSCLKNSNYRVVSFSLSVNGGKKIQVMGNLYQKGIPQLKEGGTLQLSDCLIECRVEGQEMQVVSAPDHLFFIRP